MVGLAATAISFSIVALGLSAFLYIKMENLENKLKDFDVIPKEFSSDS